MPEPYAPPVQRAPLEEIRPYRATRIVNMADPDAGSHFVKDITGGLEGGTWRWVGKRPTVRVMTRANEGVHYSIDFTLAEATFKDTGPVIMSFFFGDHLLERVPYAEFGHKHFDKLVPPEWIVPGENVLLSAEIDKVWVSKVDGATLGFLLTSIGLTQPS